MATRKIGMGMPSLDGFEMQAQIEADEHVLSMWFSSVSGNKRDLIDLYVFLIEGRVLRANLEFASTAPPLTSCKVSEDQQSGTQLITLRFDPGDMVLECREVVHLRTLKPLPPIVEVE